MHDLYAWLFEPNCHIFLQFIAGRSIIVYFVLAFVVRVWSIEFCPIFLYSLRNQTLGIYLQYCFRSNLPILCIPEKQILEVLLNPPITLLVTVPTLYFLCLFCVGNRSLLYLMTSIPRYSCSQSFQPSNLSNVTLKQMDVNSHCLMPKLSIPLSKSAGYTSEQVSFPWLPFKASFACIFAWLFGYMSAHPKLTQTIE